MKLQANKNIKLFSAILSLCFTTNCTTIDQHNNSGHNVPVKISKGVLKCLNNTIEHEKVSLDTLIISDFIIQNTGVEPIKILEYSVSCGCTHAFISDSVIKPECKEVFTMQINTQGKTPGKHSVIAILKTNGKKKYYKLESRFIINEGMK